MRLSDRVMYSVIPCPPCFFLLACMMLPLNVMNMASSMGRRRRRGYARMPRWINVSLRVDAI